VEKERCWERLVQNSSPSPVFYNILEKYVEGLKLAYFNVCYFIREQYKTLQKKPNRSASSPQSN